MVIENFVVGELLSNAYIVSNENKAIIIDLGGDSSVLDGYIEKNKLTVEAILLTHGHFDHIGGVKYYQQKGAKVYIHSADADMIPSTKNLASLFGASVEPFHVDYTVVDNEMIYLCGLEITCIHTPGHTVGGMCYLISNNLFTGDTLFFEGVGRSDFPGGDHAQLIESIESKIFSLESSIKVLPGHGRQTTIGYEMQNNPYILGDDLYDY